MITPDNAPDVLVWPGASITEKTTAIRTAPAKYIGPTRFERGSNRRTEILLDIIRPNTPELLEKCSSQDNWGSRRSRIRLLCFQLVTRHDSVTAERFLGIVSNGTQFFLTSWCPMEYKTIVQTVVETPTYLAIANKLCSEEERADIVALVAADPECGDLIRGTGGFRKVRVARKGMGKSGGARDVYIWRNETFPLFLITVFPKNKKENLTMAERNALKKRADSIFETYGR